MQIMQMGISQRHRILGKKSMVKPLFYVISPLHKDSKNITKIFDIDF